MIQINNWLHSWDKNLHGKILFELNIFSLHDNINLEVSGDWRNYASFISDNTVFMFKISMEPPKFYENREKNTTAMTFL